MPTEEERVQYQLKKNLPKILIVCLGCLILVTIGKLALKPDKTELSATINKATSLNEENYTTVSYDALQEALLNAEKILNNGWAGQAKVDKNTTALQKAMDALAESTKCRWEISYSLHRTENDSVGNDWSSSVSYNGDQVQSGFIVVATEETSISIRGKAVEHDSYPDSGTGTVSLLLKDGNVATQTFYVREDRGKYAGNRAVWELEVSCKLLERI